MELKQTLIDSAAWRKRIDGTQSFLFALTSDEGKRTFFLFLLKNLTNISKTTRKDEYSEISIKLCRRSRIDCATRKNCAKGEEDFERRDFRP